MHITKTGILDFSIGELIINPIISRYNFFFLKTVPNHVNKYYTRYNHYVRFLNTDIGRDLSGYCIVYLKQCHPQSTSIVLICLMVIFVIIMMKDKNKPNQLWGKVYMHAPLQRGKPVVEKYNYLKRI